MPVICSLVQEHFEEPLDWLFHAHHGPNYYHYVSTLDEVVHDIPSPHGRLTALHLTVAVVDDSEDVDSDCALKLELNFCPDPHEVFDSEDDQVELNVEGRDRTIVAAVSADLEAYIEREILRPPLMSKSKVTAAKWLLVVSSVVGLGRENMLLFWVAVGFAVCRGAVGHILDKPNNWIRPFNVFLVGDEIDRFTRAEARRSKFFWGVAVAFFVSVLASAATAVLSRVIE